MSSLAVLALALLLDAPVKDDAPFGWKAGKDHRFVWVRNGQKVGETTFQIQAAPPESGAKGSASDAATAGKDGASPSYRILSTRQYDDAGVSQRGEGTTLLREDGTPLKFHATLNLNFVDKRQFQQETYIDFSDGKAHPRFLQAGKEQAPSDVEIPKGGFLYASQAVEHWAVFLSRLPATFEKHVAKLYYPDFGKVMDVTFEKEGTEPVRTGQGNTEATRYRFYSIENNLKGTVWLDTSRRLLQIEFPGATKEKALRVTLAE